MIETSNHKCPVCDVNLSRVPGDKLSPTNGIMLFCQNVNCSAQSVEGHGDNENKAYDIVVQKHSRAKNPSMKEK